MKTILLLYKTKTGFTKQYADWIGEEINCEAVPFEKVDTIEISDYRIIIYGGGMHAGRILGLNEFRKKIINVVDKKIVVFATGGAPYTEEIASKIKKDNFLEEEKTRAAFFYFQSGINYEKMSLPDKTIMKIYSKILQLKSDRSEIEDGTKKAISASYDHSSKEYIKPMIAYLKELLSE